MFWPISLQNPPLHASANLKCNPETGIATPLINASSRVSNYRQHTLCSTQRQYILVVAKLLHCVHRRVKFLSSGTTRSESFYSGNKKIQATDRPIIFDKAIFWKFPSFFPKKLIFRAFLRENEVSYSIDRNHPPCHASRTICRWIFFAVFKIPHVFYI